VLWRSAVHANKNSNLIKLVALFAVAHVKSSSVNAPSSSGYSSSAWCAKKSNLVCQVDRKSLLSLL
jgi:hypothetical protein